MYIYIYTQREKEITILRRNRRFVFVEEGEAGRIEERTEEAGNHPVEGILVVEDSHPGDILAEQDIPVEGKRPSHIPLEDNLTPVSKHNHNLKIKKKKEIQ